MVPLKGAGAGNRNFQSRHKRSAPIITPLVVPWITIQWGWRWAFIITALWALSG
jgi:hypothetical protein